jgi:hypothetical protein
MPAVEKCMGPQAANTGNGPLQTIALKRPFAACGKLRPRFVEASKIAGSAQNGH